MLLNLQSLSVAAVAQTGGYPDGLALSGKWLYVANAASNTMSVFSGLSSPTTLGNVTYPFGVAVLPGSNDSNFQHDRTGTSASHIAGGGRRRAICSFRAEPPGTVLRPSYIWKLSPSCISEGAGQSEVNVAFALRLDVTRAGERRHVQRLRSVRILHGQSGRAKSRLA